MFFSEKQWTQKIFRNVLQLVFHARKILFKGEVFYMREKKLFNIFRHAGFCEDTLEYFL